VCTCLLVPVWLLWRMRRDVPRRARYLKDTVPQPRWLVFFIGPGEWVDVSEKHRWYNRYQSMVKPHREERYNFIGLNFAIMFVIAWICVLEPQSNQGCGNQRLAWGLVYLLQSGVEALLCPHARPRDNWTDVLVGTLNSVALFIMAAAFYNNKPEDDELFKTADTLMATTLFLLVPKLLLDGLTEAWIFYKKRRHRIQQKLWGLDSAEDPLLLTSVDVSTAASKSPSRALLSSSPDPPNADESDGSIVIKCQPVPPASPGRDVVDVMPLPACARGRRVNPMRRGVLNKRELLSGRHSSSPLGPPRSLSFSERFFDHTSPSVGAIPVGKSRRRVARTTPSATSPTLQNFLQKGYSTTLMPSSPTWDSPQMEDGFLPSAPSGSSLHFASDAEDLDSPAAPGTPARAPSFKSSFRKQKSLRQTSLKTSVKRKSVFEKSMEIPPPLPRTGTMV